MSMRRTVRSSAGPLLILTGCLIVFRHYVFGGMISTVPPDLLPFWLPVHCFLGKEVAAGIIPGWNPYAVGGVPFAANPQSGWMNLPAMLFYAWLPCATAVRVFLVMHPLLAGLGAYWFLRSEGTTRVAATVGGLALSIPIASSDLGLTPPFAGSLAWTTMLLACVSRCIRSERWSGRLLWVALASIAWGQVAAQHVSFGLVLATGAAALFLLFRMIETLTTSRGSFGRFIVLMFILAGSFAVVNLAFFLPRLAFIPRTSLSLGYDELRRPSNELTTVERQPERQNRQREDDQVVAVRGSTAVLDRESWPSFELPSGAYLGMGALALSGAGWWSRRHRVLVAALTAYALVCYLLTLKQVGRVVVLILPDYLANLYTHQSRRFVYGILLALALLAGLGLEAWMKASPRARFFMLIPGAFLALAPMLLISPPEGAATVLVVAGAFATGMALLASSARPLLIILVPIVMAFELVINGVGGLAFAATGPSKKNPPAFRAPREPAVNASDYTRAGPIVHGLRESVRDGRFMTLAPEVLETGIQRYKGYLLFRAKPYWGLVANQRAMLFSLDDAQGHGPVQLLRYWRFLRVVTDERIKYSTAIFLKPPPVALDLLQVTSIVGTSHPPLPGLSAVTSNGEWTVYGVGRAPPRASIVSSWTEVDGSADALDTVTGGGFDPDENVVLEKDPGIPSSTGPSGGRAVYEQVSTQTAKVEVSAPRPSLVLIRNVFDRNWRARVDGETAPVLAADYLIQAVAVPSGRHTVVLEYHDPWVERGLAGSAFGLLALVVAYLFVRRSERSNEEPGEEDPDRREIDMRSSLSAVGGRAAQERAAARRPSA
jgi:hypothetical protein